MRLAALIVLCLGLSACSDPALYLSLPSEAPTHVVAIGDEVYVVSQEDSVEGIETTRDGKLQAVAYLGATQDLPLEPGRLEPAAMGCRLVDQIIPDGGRYAASIEDGVIGPWASVSAEALKPPLSTIRIPVDGLCRYESRCADFDTKLVGVPDESNPNWALSLPDGSVWLSTGRDIWCLEADETVESVGVPLVTTAFESADLDSDGLLWLGTEDGRIFSLDPDAPSESFEERATLPTVEEIRWIVAESSTSGPELITLTAPGSLNRLHAGTWSLLHSFRPPGGNTNPYGGLVRASDGRVFVAWSLEAVVLEIDGDEVRDVTPPNLEPEAATAIGWDDSLGLVLGSSSLGAIFQRPPGGEWRRFEDFSLGSQVRTIGFYRDTFLIGGLNGQARQFLESELCPIIQPVAADIVSFNPWQDDRLVVTYHTPRGGGTGALTILTPKSPRQSD